MLLRRTVLVAWGLVLLAAGIGPASGQVLIEGQRFDARARVGGQDLALNGVGLRAVAWLKGYAAGLYLVNKAGTADQVLAMPGPKRLQLRMLQEVSTQEFVKAFDRGVKRNTDEAALSALLGRMEQFDAIVTALGKVRKGDLVDLDFLPGQGLLFTHNGQRQGQPVAGDDFYAALLRVFLGPKPSDPELKAGLLGGPPVVDNDRFCPAPPSGDPEMKRRTLGLTTAAVLGMLAAGNVLAQTYPTKPVRLIVPFAPGGTTDIVARIVSEKMGASLGQQVLVENKAGGGGSIGALEMIKSTPDGHVLGMATVSTTAANPAINPRIGYDPAVDMVPVINIAATPNVIAVHPSFPARDYKGFVAELKKNPGKYSYASSGTGGIGHLQTELYKSLAGVFMTHIPYRGAGPALNDVVAGQVPVIFDNLPSALPFIKDKRLVPIVVAAPQRLAVLPDVPTFKEVGLEPVNRMAYYGVLAPKGTPRDVVNKVAASVKKVLEDPVVRKRIEDTGSLIVGNTPEQFAEQMKAELEVYKQVVTKQKLKLD